MCLILGHIFQNGGMILDVGYNEYHIILFFLQSDETKTAKKGIDMNALGKSLETLLGKGRPEDSNWSYNSQNQSLPHPSILDDKHR